MGSIVHRDDLRPLQHREGGPDRGLPRGAPLDHGGRDGQPLEARLRLIRIPGRGGDHDRGDAEDGARVDHGRAHLRLELHFFFDEGAQSLENHVQDAARFARGHHVRVERVERLGLRFRQRIEPR